MNDEIEKYKYDMLTIASQYYKLGGTESRAIITAIEHAEILRKLKGGATPENACG